MRLNTANFGTLEVGEDKFIIFKDGIPGFKELKKYILIESENGKFQYLQSVEDSNVCFTMINPYSIKEDYAPVISESYFEKLGGGKSQEFTLYAVVCLKKPIEESTVNLAGPLLIHVDRRVGVQVITEDKHYTTRHNLLELIRGGK